MLISSHRINEVSSLVNRVVELDMGKVVLDETLAQDSLLTGLCTARVVCRQAEPALAKALSAWGFTAMDETGTVWQGTVPGPDRLRFLGMVSRYVAVISDVSLQEAQP
jgi:ABC-2 type transport system ATP-binding protein